MGCKVMQLFRDEEMIVRKSLSRVDFEDSIKGGFAENILKSCTRGVLKTKDDLKDRSRSFTNKVLRPNTLNSNIQGFMIEEFKENCRFNSDGRFYLEINGNKLFCKKIGKNYRPCNVPTKKVKMYNEQKSNDKDDTLPITYIGYRVSATCTELLGVYAVHMSGGDIEWISDISELAYLNISEQKTNINKNLDSDINVTPKSNTKRQIK